jgi:hypothetical protein
VLQRRWDCRGLQRLAVERTFQDGLHIAGGTGSAGQGSLRGCFHTLARIALAQPQYAQTLSRPEAKKLIPANELGPQGSDV